MSQINGVINTGKAAMNVTIVYILISVLASAVGQVLLKKGMGGMGPLTLTTDQLWGILGRMATNPFVIAGLAVYGVGTVFWLVVLSRADLSYAYPFAALQYAVMLAAGWWLFDESITSMRLLGTLVVGIGVFLISRS
jgi:drug/metabolite transporter (DMT)-like permease